MVYYNQKGGKKMGNKNKKAKKLKKLIIKSILQILAGTITGMLLLIVEKLIG